MPVQISIAHMHTYMHVCEAFFDRALFLWVFELWLFERLAKFIWLYACVAQNSLVQPLSICSALGCVTQCSAAEDADTGSDPYSFLSSVTSTAWSSVQSKQLLVNVTGSQVFSIQSVMFTFSQKEMSSLICSFLFLPDGWWGVFRK